MKRLTKRKLKAIVAALAIVEAGSPADLTGSDDSRSKRLYDDCLEALEWAREKLADKECDDGH